MSWHNFPACEPHGTLPHLLHKSHLRKRMRKQHPPSGPCKPECPCLCHTSASCVRPQMLRRACPITAYTQCESAFRHGLSPLIIPLSISCSILFSLIRMYFHIASFIHTSIPLIEYLYTVGRGAIYPNIGVTAQVFNAEPRQAVEVVVECERLGGHVGT